MYYIRAERSFDAYLRAESARSDRKKERCLIEFNRILWVCGVSAREIIFRVMTLPGILFTRYGMKKLCVSLAYYFSFVDFMLFVER